MAKILITCFGSYGDLHPYIALAKNLTNRGHDVSIGSSIIYKTQIESEKLSFVHIRTRIDQFNTPRLIQDFVRRIFDPNRGGEVMVKELMNNIENTYQDTLKATNNCDFVLSNPLSYTTPIVCRQKGIPWFSTILAPMFFLSVYEPPILAPAPWLQKIHKLSPLLYRTLFKLLKASTKPWTKPVYQLCARHQLPPPRGYPLFEGQYSPDGTLAMFPAWYAKPQTDWPAHTWATGFPQFSVEMSDPNKLEQLQHFVDNGEPPIVFALGSSAVNIAGDFYKISAATARNLNRRAVLVYGDHQDSIKDITPGSDLFFANYVSYEKLFRHACLVVHQGGIGTLAQSLAAQRPILVVPFGFDQFDNGERIEKLGVGKYIARKDYTQKKLTPLIEEILTNAHYQAQAKIIGERLKSEDGVSNACDVIERQLNLKPKFIS